MQARAGIRDVARAAGVSTTTVSHALSGRGKVSAATRLRVEQVARELGYQPDRVASALRASRTGVLGFVSDEVATTPFAGRIVLGAQDAAWSLGVVLMVVNSGRSPDVERRQIEVLRAQRIDALLHASMFHRVLPAPLGYTDGPVVMVNSSDRQGAVSSVTPDEVQVGRDATARLLASGHRRVAHLTIDEHGPAVDGRAAGHREVMASAGLDALVVEVHGPADAAAGRRALERAFETAPGVTAVFAFNDPMAMGVFQEAAARDLRVPDDLSVVSVDNLELIASQILPGLTTFELPHYEMGRWALERAVLEATEKDVVPEAIELRCVRVERASIRDLS